MQQLRSEWLFCDHIPAFNAMCDADISCEMFLNTEHDDLEDLEKDEASGGGILGLFRGDDMVAMARLGVADWLINDYKLPYWSVLVLSDVWVPAPERGKGYGKTIVKEAIRRAQEFEKDGQEVVIDLLDKDLNPWYQALGFENDARFASEEDAQYHMHIVLKEGALHPDAANEDTDELGLRIRALAYEKYRLAWIISQNLTLKDLMKEIEGFLDGWNSPFINPGDTCSLSEVFETWEAESDGFGGSLWVCFDEFLGAEYQDKEYMKGLLNDSEYQRYLEDMKHF